eukprot:11203894-Lingulodinium_polyedra.AAC.1
MQLKQHAIAATARISQRTRPPARAPPYSGARARCETRNAATVTSDSSRMSKRPCARNCARLRYT